MIIAQYYGGSNSYGLAIENVSDLDIRGIYLSTNKSEIIGLSRNDHKVVLNETEDSQFFELRHYLNLLKKGNSQGTELLFNNIWINKAPEFDLIQSNKYNLISSERLFKCLLGYLNGEKHIITGQNTRELGAKRKEQLEKFGYSYRNCVHALRLARTGVLFFRDNIYPINIVKEDKEYGEFIRDVKLNPQNYKVDELISLIEKFEGELKKVFDSRSKTYIFNEDVANELCFKLYLPILLDNVK